MTQARRGRKGDVFAIRLAPGERDALERRCAEDYGPRKLGPWMVWRALHGSAIAGGSAPPGGSAAAAGSARARGSALARGSASSSGSALAIGSADPPPEERLILDLCAGSGSWSKPYEQAGYRVIGVDPLGGRGDVRTFQPPPERVWGVLAAPPCTQFSLARNGAHDPRDFVQGMACVNACMRIVLQVRPRWWALENPTGLLSRFLGHPRDVFEPFEYGDPWSKRTALWGDFATPERGPYVSPLDGGGPICARCFPDSPRVCSDAGHRAATAPGFARAFFEANP